MNYSIEKLDDVLLVKLKGSVWGELESYQLKDEIRVQLDIGARKFLMDLSEVGFVNSLGVGLIVSSLVSIRREDGELKLYGIGRRAMAVFEVTRVIDLLDVFDTREEALASFS
jgi:anti-sigma B factor antagonist